MGKFSNGFKLYVVTRDYNSYFLQFSINKFILKLPQIITFINLCNKTVIDVRMRKLPVELYIVRTINLAFSSSFKDVQHSKSCSEQNPLTSMSVNFKSFEM